MTSTPDPRLVEAGALARAALAEVTPAATIGDPVGHTVEDDGVVSLRFANRMAGYPGWFWTVSVAAADAETAPTVLEVELLPGEGALTAPDWVPWAVRLADYQAAQAALAEAAADDESDDDLDESDEDEDLDDDLDNDGSDESDEDDDLDDALDDDEDDADPEASDPAPRLHAGDVDGVDIDELDDAQSDDDLDDAEGVEDQPSR